MMNHHGILCILSYSFIPNKPFIPPLCKIFFPEIPSERYWTERHGDCCPISPQSRPAIGIINGDIIALWTVRGSKNENPFCINGFAPGYQNDFWQAESLLKVLKSFKGEKLKCLTWKSSEEDTEKWLLWVIFYLGAPGISSLLVQISAVNIVNIFRKSAYMSMLDIHKCEILRGVWPW